MMRNTLPHNLEVERALLGALLMDARCIVDVPESLVPEGAMYHPAHDAILQIIRRLDAKQATIDTTTVGEQLITDGTELKLKPLGGLAYLGVLSTAAVTTENVGYYAKLIAGYHRRREVMVQTAELYDAAKKGSEAWEEPAWSKLRDTVEMPTIGVVCADGRMLATELQATLEQRAADAAAGTIPGIATGIETLDMLLRTGWIVGREYLIAGRPGDGKTSLVCQIAKYAAIMLRVPTLIISSEMDRCSLVEKIAVDMADVNSDNLARGVVSAEDWAALYRAISLIADAPLWVADGSMTISDIRSRVLLWHRRLPPGTIKAFVLIDFFQILDHQIRRGENQTQAMSRSSKLIKRLAGEAKVALVMVSAMTRDAEKEARRPRKSDLRECGGLESDTDAILFLHRPVESEYTEFILTKHRFGPTGLANMRFDGSRTRYLDVPQDEREVAPAEPPRRKRRKRPPGESYYEPTGGAEP